MGIVDSGLSGLALLLSGSVVNRPAYCALGSGSVAFSPSTVLLDNEYQRNAFASTDSSIQKNVTYTTDFAAIDLSGTSISEIGIFSSGASLSGTLWNYEGFVGINFDGTNELQVQITFQIY